MAARKKPRRHRFTAELVEGHKGVVAAIVPFDPETTFRTKPARLHQRRHGWLVRGTLNGAPFEGYVGERWGRFFITLDAEALALLELAAGDAVTFALESTTDPEIWDLAIQQSKVTTQPGKARPDALER